MSLAKAPTDYTTYTTNTTYITYIAYIAQTAETARIAYSTILLAFWELSFQMVHMPFHNAIYRVLSQRFANPAVCAVNAVNAVYVGVYASRGGAL
jgi:uncharacterized membrane protein